MSIIYQLSSQQKERSERGNGRVCKLVLNNPVLIHEIVDCLDCKDPALLGDCVEVGQCWPAMHAEFISRKFSD